MEETNRRVITIHRPRKKENKMNEMITGLVAPLLRKLIIGACSAWITILIEKGVLTQPQVDTMIQGAIALALFAVTALWTWGKNKINSKTAMTVPTVSVPTVVSAVAISSPK